MELENKNEKWRMLVREFEESNKSRKEWCAEKKISPHRFGYWFSIFGADSKNKNKEIVSEDSFKNSSIERKTISTSNWVEIKLPKEENKSNLATAKSIEIKIGKAEISISAGFDKDLLKEIVKVLGEI